MPDNTTVIRPVHRVSAELDRRWRNFCFFTRKTSTYHMEKAMELYLSVEVKKEKEALNNDK